MPYNSEHKTSVDAMLGLFLALRSIKGWKLLLETVELWHVVENDIGIVGVMLKEVLMIFLGGIKTLQRYNLGNDRFGKGLILNKLLDVVVGNAFLLVVCVKDHRPVLGTVIGTLTIQFGWIVGDEEEYFNS
jgi:hypothetical protein